MAKYEWADFEKEPFFPELINFFEDLMPPSKNEKIINIVFVSRKAYCLFLLWKFKGLIDDKNYHVYTERFVMKNFDKDLFKGEDVKLVDDTVSSGNHFKEVCVLLREKTSVQKISPCIFMMNTEVDKKKYNEEVLFSCGNPINYRMKCGASDILEFCAIEMLIIHQENIPYMVELPSIREEGNENYYITVNREEYDLLKKGNDIWKCNSYKQLGYEKNEVNTDVFIRKKHILQDSNNDFIFSLSVRVQVTKCDENVKLVIIPFAILKSISYEKLEELFYLIFENTEYADEIKNYQNECQNCFEKESFVALYRALVFNYSMYIGREFIEYLNSILESGRRFQVTLKDEKYNYTKKFLRSIEKIQQGDYADYIIKMLGFGRTGRIATSENRMLKYVDTYQGIDFDYRTVSLYFLATIEEIRRESNTRKQSDKNYKFCTIEEYQELLEKTYPQQEEKERNELLATCIANMLSQNRVSNEICYDAGKNVIYRGFNYGENSEAYFDVASQIFYAAVREYYEILKEESSESKMILRSYQERYPKFLFQLMNFLEEYKLFGTVVTRSEFKIYSEIFKAKNQTDIKNIIKKKEFLLNTKEHPYYIEAVQNYIRKTEI